MRTPALTITVYNKAYQRRGPIRGLLKADVSFRWNQAGTATFAVRSTDRRIPDLRTPGCRAVIEYWADRDDTDPTLAMSGLVSVENGAPRTGQQTAITFTLEDDWVEVFQGLIGWVRPDKSIDKQGDDEEAFYEAEGPAETVAKTIIGLNKTRAGLNLTVPASAGRGDDISVQIRFHPLVDRLFPAVDEAGIGLQVLQQGAGRVLLTHVQTAYPEVLTDATGEVIDGEYTLSAPTVTRIVAGAAGKKDQRIFRTYVDSARETQWGMRREEFLDVDGIEYSSRTFEVAVLARMMERLRETGPTSGCSAKLQQSRRLVIGDRIGLGTQVQVQLGNGPVVTDLVREIRVSTGGAGIEVLPLVGWWDESGDRKLWDLIAAGNKRARNQGVE